MCKLINPGRCQYFRSVYIEEVNREELVKLGQIEKGKSYNELQILYKIVKYIKAVIMISHLGRVNYVCATH